MSDDGTQALTVIAFVGSVFSPYYAWAGRIDPLDHVALNVALYHRRGGAWSMTERGRADLQRSADTLQIGPSGLFVDGDDLKIAVDERGWPIPRRLTGKIRVIPEVRVEQKFLLEKEGGHHWWPIAPRARVEIEFERPATRWSGSGYLDCNFGDAPIEDAFHSWTWSRAPLSRGAVVLYDVTPKAGTENAMALRFDASGVAHAIQLPPKVPLRSTLFGIRREMRSDAGAEIVHTLTDAHFYARSVLRAELCGERVVGVHESLSLDRFARPWAKWMLPFRMPRLARRSLLKDAERRLLR